MIQNILNLLQVCKEHKLNGEYIDIALGKNKYPESIKEAYNLFRREL